MEILSEVLDVRLAEPSHAGEYADACDTNEPRVASITSSRGSRVRVLVSGATISDSVE